MTPLAVISLVLLILQALGQAPGDFNPICRTSASTNQDHIFPNNWTLLLDSYDYQNLYNNITNPPPVWVAMSFDGDNANVS